MNNHRFDELIEKAKQGSKDDFLRFITGIYGIDECVFNHMWNIPVIAPFDGDTLVTTSLSTRTEDELIDIVDEFIVKELEDSDGCFILLNKMAIEFKEEEIEEWQEKLDSGELKLNYNAIIVYNETKLQKRYKELIETNFEKEKSKTEKELEQIFVDYVKSILIKELCHLNANYFEANEKNNKITSNKDKYNEISVDILRKMMNNYQEGNSIEDCLLKIIKYGNWKSQYENIDEKEVLTMYVLHPEELTEWAIFGAYDYIRENKLQKIIINVCGEDILPQPSQLKKKVEKYVATLENGALSNKQTEMLKILGFSINKENKKILENKYDNENTNYLEVINKKPNFIKKIIKKIYNFFTIQINDMFN